MSVSLVFHNNGDEEVPDSYDRNGLNYQLLKNRQWNKVYWEIAHLGRDNVTSLELRYRTQGNEPGATDTVSYYFDELFLEKVKPDYFEGWEVAPGHIAYNHIGYAADFPKTALAANLSADQFSLVDVRSNKQVMRKSISEKETLLGKFQVLDFSELVRPGNYVLEAGDVRTRPFRIDRFETIYRNTIIKTINHFYTQRCGIDIPGVHAPCHRDWTGTYNDQTVIINGGWHDAGDLSQGVGNTAAAAHAMFLLADRIRESDPELSVCLIEEGKWGLDWMLKTRFDDGARFRFSTMDFWTDGIIGTVDDVPGRARISSQANLYCAKTEARAAIALMQGDSALANYALRIAESDWAIALEHIRRMGVETAGAIVNASLTLFEATSDDKYKNTALAYGDSILGCQQQENLAEDVPIKGFFYQSLKRENILNYSHQSHEQEPVVGLVRLCEFFPDHANKGKWTRALRLYAEYYKTVLAYTDPYFMIPAGIYDLTRARDDVEREQIRNGVGLNDRYYLKRFPTWTSFRGNSGTTLSQAKGLAAVARYLSDRELLHLSARVLDWHLGFNPFAQSLMYGEGYRYAAQYSTMSGNLVGGLPVGVQTHFNRDEPYWPAENCYNWKEIWVFPSGRWLWMMSDFFQ